MKDQKKNKGGRDGENHRAFPPAVLDVFFHDCL
jgi:hypothetical protein